MHRANQHQQKPDLWLLISVTMEKPTAQRAVSGWYHGDAFDAPALFPNVLEGE